MEGKTSVAEARRRLIQAALDLESATEDEGHQLLEACMPEAGFDPALRERRTEAPKALEELERRKVAVDAAYAAFVSAIRDELAAP